ncbi:MAG: nucleotide exchange factor GrpE [Marinilabiliaceae bacterium]|nr:nucleotide exchange factor GrpE [Marinilabiliaceae bacterium]
MVKKTSKKQDVKEETKAAEQETQETVVNEESADNSVECEEKTDEPVVEEPVIDELALLKDKLTDANDKYLRLSAEYDNYRKRTLKEKMELMKTAGESIILSLLPVIDDFDRAMAHMDEAKDTEAVLEGMKLIHNKFKDFLSQKGVQEIEAKEKEFDTDLHEAVTKIPAPTEEMKGKVIDCIEKGYTLQEKVIRFSKVVVGE